MVSKSEVSTPTYCEGGVRRGYCIEDDATHWFAMRCKICSNQHKRGDSCGEGASSVDDAVGIGDSEHE